MQGKRDVRDTITLYTGYYNTSRNLQEKQFPVGGTKLSQKEISCKNQEHDDNVNNREKNRE